MRPECSLKTGKLPRDDSFPDAELREYGVQDVLNVDRTSDFSEGFCSNAKFL